MGHDSKVFQDLLRRLRPSIMSTVVVVFCIAARATTCADFFVTPTERTKISGQMRDLDQSRDRLRISSDGGIEFDGSGFPDRFTYAAALRAIRISEADGREPQLSASERDLIATLRSALEISQRHIFSGENQLLRSTRYSEPVANGVTTSLGEFIRSERFKTQVWWMRNDNRNDFLRSQNRPKDIKFENSNSTILKALGPGSGSFVYWPIKRNDGYGPEAIPDLKGPHVRLNLDRDGNERTLELIAPTGRTLLGRLKWSAFMFEKIEGQWVPRVNALNQNQKTNCITCHYSTGAFGARSLSPKPFFLDSTEKFQAVGYQDHSLIERFLRQF